MQLVRAGGVTTAPPEPGCGPQRSAASRASRSRRAALSPVGKHQSDVTQHHPPIVCLHDLKMDIGNTADTVTSGVNWRQHGGTCGSTLRSRSAFHSRQKVRSCGLPAAAASSNSANRAAKSGSCAEHPHSVIQKRRLPGDDSIGRPTTSLVSCVSPRLYRKQLCQGFAHHPLKLTVVDDVDGRCKLQVAQANILCPPTPAAACLSISSNHSANLPHANGGCVTIASAPASICGNRAHSPLRICSNASALLHGQS